MANPSDTPSRRGAAPAAAAAALSAALLAACAGYSPRSVPAGASAAEIAAQMGQPTARYTVRAVGDAAFHERLEYARGPMGKHTYMLDLDEQGRLARWEQVLLENNFNAIRAGDSRDSVLLRIGHPSHQGWLPWQKYTLWSYRYETTFCQWFQVSLDAAGKVAETGYGPDPLCSRDGDDSML